MQIRTDGGAATHRAPLAAAFIASLTLVLGCTRSPGIEPGATVHSINSPESDESLTEAKQTMEEPGLETATFGAGCYWCTEAVFQRLEGVSQVVSGFMGGAHPKPTYEEVCQGTTGHAEVIQFRYDPARISFEELLEVFWKTHDPTTLNQQGHDVGTQYRSAVFYHTEAQRMLAEQYKAKLDSAGVFDKPIVTEITEASQFFAAKDVHQNYYNLNPNQGYCSFVIRPKIDKLEKVFADKLKKASSE